MEKHSLVPPTFTRVNDFTFPFQEIVSTYGIPSYQEVNPAFFTVITFPFLFGVMFGDICHGLVLIAISALLCLYGDTLVRSKSIFASMIRIRYLFLLMGIFAVFCGFIYNDFAGLNLNIFKSCFYAVHESDEALQVKRTPGCSYYFGMDPFWKYSMKQLQFENSFKMKLAVILGVLHMFLGVILKLVNSLHFGRILDALFEFLPQVVFLLALFGYMDLMIILKWLTHYEDTNQTPNIITSVINIFIGFGKTTDTVFDAQPTMNYVILLLIVLCVPAMLLPKPLILSYQHKHAAAELESSSIMLLNK